MGVARSFFLLDAAFASGGLRRIGGRFFCCLLIAAPAGAASQWELLLEVERSGVVTVAGQKTVDGPPSPPAAPLQEGLTCLELRDEAGRLIDRRALPLAPAVFYDAEGPGGALTGGPAEAPRAQYHVLLPRRPGDRSSLQFFKIRRRNAGVSRAAAVVGGAFDLEPLGAATLEEGR